MQRYETERHSDGEEPLEVEDAQADQVEQLLSLHVTSEYVDAVVRLAEQSERNYRAAVLAGQVVNGVTDSTNY